jgi:hypothetical protein
VFIIKIKVNGYLKNLTENTQNLINTNAIKKSNIITYIDNDTKHILMIEKSQIKLHRENIEFSHVMTFKKNKTISSEYYMKENNYLLEFNILTTNIIISENKIDITYKIIESENVYNYVLEMSDNL